MKKIYSKPSSLVINLEAEQMIAASETSGTIEDVPMHGGKSCNRNSSFWDEEPFSNNGNDIWK